MQRLIGSGVDVVQVAPLLPIAVHQVGLAGAERIVAARLAGEEYNHNNERYFCTYSTEYLKDLLYKEYKNYRKREKGVFVIRTGYHGYLLKMGKRNMYYCHGIAGAKTFISKEDAQVYIKQHNICGLSEESIRECEYENGYLKEK